MNGRMLYDMLTSRPGNWPIKLPCGCDTQAVADALDATGQELHQQDCTLQTGYGQCLQCGHLIPEHDAAGCQHDMGPDWADGDERVYCGCTRPSDKCPRCKTCGNVIEHQRCTCWALLADALQRYAGFGFDDAAQRAAMLWLHGDQERVHQGTWLDDTIPATGSPDAIVAALARMDYPGESESGDCLLCGIAGNGCWQWHHTSCDGGCRRRTGAVCDEDNYTGGGGRMVQNPSPAEPSSHRTDCPWRQAREWVAR